MWPINPDDFESHVHAPQDQQHDDAWYFLCINGQIACMSEQGIPRPISADEFRWLDLEIFSEHFLGRFRGRSCFAIEGRGTLPEGYVADSLYAWLGRVEPAVFYLAGCAQQVIEWHNTHQHCGRCGGAMEDHRADRAKVCSGCGLINYPRIAPSIIVLVTKGDEMLLARNAQWPTGMYSTLAGFVEVGESIEQTLHREVQEEVGLQVDNLNVQVNDATGAGATAIDWNALVTGNPLENLSGAQSLLVSGDVAINLSGYVLAAGSFA